MNISLKIMKTHSIYYQRPLRHFKVQGFVKHHDSYDGFKNKSFQLIIHGTIGSARVVYHNRRDFRIYILNVNNI